MTKGLRHGDLIVRKGTTMSDRNGLGIWKQRKGKYDQDRLNHEQRVSSQDEAGDTHRALSLTEGCGATARSQAFAPGKDESQWRSERQDIKEISLQI